MKDMDNFSKIDYMFGKISSVYPRFQHDEYYILDPFYSSKQNKNVIIRLSTVHNGLEFYEFFEYNYLVDKEFVIKEIKRNIHHNVLKYSGRLN